MMEEVDFTSCPRVPGLAYNGANGKNNYRDFLATSDDPGLAAALAALRPRIAALDFAALVGETPYLSPLQREFLTTYLNARRERIL